MKMVYSVGSNNNFDKSVHQAIKSKRNAMNQNEWTKLSQLIKRFAKEKPEMLPDSQI